ncbi:MAG TPA: hypothetical protein VGF84_07265 [Micromonosporaceae bacterium]
MSDYPPPPPQGSDPVDPGDSSSRYQPYPGAGPQYGGAPYGGAPSPGQPYPGQPYPGQPYPGGGGQPPGGMPPAPPSGGGPGRFDDAFHGRLARRPEPRFTAALAGVGAGLALLGVLIWGFTYYIEGLFGSFNGDSFGDTDRNLLGAGLGALLVVAGYGVSISQRRGPLGTAGVVLAGIGAPLTMAFLTIDATSSSGLNLDAVFWVSVVIWAATYIFVPGAKGHTFFVFLIADGLLTYALAKTSNNGGSDIVFGNGPHVPGSGTVAAIGLLFGAFYYAIAFALDRAGRHGPATGLVFPAFGATAIGIIAWSSDIHRAGAGVLTIVIGLAVCWYGGRYGRRLTCFAAAGGVAAGIALIVADAVGDNGGVGAGVSFLLIGIAVVVVAAVLGRVLDEPHDMDAEAVAGSR